MLVSSCWFQRMASLPTGFDADLSEGEQAMGFIAAALYMQAILESIGCKQLLEDDDFTYMVGASHIIANSLMIEVVSNRKCLTLDLEGILWDGSGMPDCGHGGRAPTSGCGSLRFHGCADLCGLVKSGGRFTIIARPLKAKPGWYHCDMENIETAMQYAYPIRIKGVGDKCYCLRAMVIVRCYCWNNCNKDTWSYTKTGCERYCIEKVLFFPASLCREVYIIHPNS